MNWKLLFTIMIKLTEREKILCKFVIAKKIKKSLQSKKTYAKVKS